MLGKVELQGKQNVICCKVQHGQIRVVGFVHRRKLVPAAHTARATAMVGKMERAQIWCSTASIHCKNEEDEEDEEEQDSLVLLAP